MWTFLLDALLKVFASKKENVMVVNKVGLE